MLAFYRAMLSAPANHIQFGTMQIFVPLLSWLDSKLLALLLKITQYLKYHVQYNVSMCHKISEISSSLKLSFNCSICKCILLIYKPGLTYSSKLGFAILAAFSPTVKQPVPKLQHVISKTASLMCKGSSQLIQCGDWEQQEV